VKITACSIPDVKLIEPNVIRDSRGYFFESFRQSWLPEQVFVQDNQSASQKDTLRGIHYQVRQPQGKLVRVVSGAVLDVAVDLRKSSKTFGHYVAQHLNSEAHQMLWVPPGFGHGFLVLSETAEFYYKCTSYYDPEDQHIIRWNDPDLAIDWGLESPILSGRDAEGNLFKDASYFP
jgi:dTDP-4-dehydrorhamnose 3,5-epimerase